MFDILAGGCTLDGDFSIAVEYICQASEAACPLDDATRTGSVSVSVESANVCPATVADVGLTGTLASYEDAALSISKTAFIVGQTSHFLATSVSSDAAITSTSILTIRHELSGVFTLLYDLGTVFSLAGANVVINAATGNPNTATFAFDVDAAVFVVPRFESDTFTISATLDVDFDGFALLMKRTVTETQAVDKSIGLLQYEQPTAQAIDSSVQLAIKSNAVEEGAGNKVVVQDEAAINPTVIYAIIGVCAVVGMLVIGAVVYMRRSSKAKGQQVAITPQQVAIQPQVQMQQVPAQYIQPTQQVHMQQMPVQQMPVQQMPVQQMSMQQIPMQQVHMQAVPMNA